MEERWYADRGRLRELLRRHPDWSKREFARELGRSLGWVKKWCRACKPRHPATIACSAASRARKHPPPRVS